MALEALARARQAQGLPAIAVAWGPIADVGVLAREQATREQLARRLSAHPFTADEALDALIPLLDSGLAAPAYASVQWDAARRRLPILASPAFEVVAAGAGEAADGDLVERLTGLGEEEAREVVMGLITEEVAKILSTTADRIDPVRPLPELGMDSLMAVELRLTLEQRLGVSLPLLSLGETTTLASLAGKVARMALEDRTDGDAFAKMAMQHEADVMETGKPAAVIAAE
jgi:acyl carrier protein